ncbi:hypothetical protein [[Mycobacterium] fortunisiensis]|uniref:hypothetical protein n=1 Tax=[Mycobacterium] fortunisiensis TaxID=2600579 RepID=UPI0027DF9928|nr:hypothetical protein [[Mycobacterium] fortunisiensis]
MADALEQQRDHAEPVPDVETSAADSDSPPLEASDQDWQEQRAVITDDSGLDEFDRER